MIKNYLPYVLAAVLLMLAGIILIHRNKGTLKQEIGDFMPGDLTLVDRFSITQNNQEITLRKVQDKWELNPNVMAGSKVIDAFFTGLQRLEIVAPASKADRQNIVQFLLNHGKQVSFYHHGKIESSFLIGFDSLAGRGNFIMDLKRKFPYRVKLKGFDEVNLEGLFSLVPGTWKQKSLFGFAEGQINEIMVDYFNDPRSSFTIFRTSNGEYKIKGLTKQVPLFVPDTQEIHDYLNYFGEIPYTPVGYSLKKYMQAAAPIAHISIKLRQGKDCHVTTYPYFRELNNSKSADPDKIIAVIEPPGDTAIVRYTEIDPVLRTLQDFQKK